MHSFSLIESLKLALGHIYGLSDASDGLAHDLLDVFMDLIVAKLGVVHLHELFHKFPCVFSIVHLADELIHVGFQILKALHGSLAAHRRHLRLSV